MDTESKCWGFATFLEVSFCVWGVCRIVFVVEADKLFGCSYVCNACGCFIGV